MSRSGYYDEIDDQWAHIRYRGALKSAMRGKRGQAFLREMLAALDALPEKKLITDKLQAEGQVCAIGSVGLARQIDMSKIDPHDPYQVANAFGINEKLAREIVYENDEAWYIRETPEQRFQRMRNWVLSQIKKDGES